MASTIHSWLPRDIKDGAREAQAARKGSTLVCVSSGDLSPSALDPYSTSPVMQMREGRRERRDEITGAGSVLCRSERSARDVGQLGSL